MSLHVIHDIGKTISKHYYVHIRIIKQFIAITFQEAIKFRTHL